MAKRSINVAEFKAECTVLERAVRSAGLTTEEKLAEDRPGSKEYPDRDARSWLRYYTKLQRLHAQLQRRASSGGTEDAEVLDALRGQPVLVELVNKEHKPVQVHPKSLHACLYVHALDLKIAWLLAQKDLLESRGTAGDVLMLPKIYEATAYVYQLLVWIVCSEGPAMPFDTNDPDPEPPEWVRNLEPWDVLRICQAHQKLMLRLQALSALIDENSAQEGKGLRPSWSMFYSTMAVELKESAEHLIKLRSVGEMLAMARLNAAAHAIPKTEETEVVR
jgi:hypothetical protein